MRLKPILVLALIFALGLALGYVVNMGSSPVDKPAPQGAKPIVPEGADIAAEDIELVQGAKGVVQWRMRARSAEYKQEKKLVVVIKPQMTSFFGTGRHEVFVRADVGEVDQAANNLMLRDNIEGRYGLFSLKAQAFDYVGALEKIYLKGQVSIHRPDMSVNATAIEINLATKELMAAGGVTALIVPQEKEEDEAPVEPPAVRRR